MLSLHERQKAIVETILGLSPLLDDSALGTKGFRDVVQRVGESARRRRFLRLRRALPRTSGAMWLEFGSVATEYFDAVPERLIDATRDAAGFADFLEPLIPNLVGVPAYAADLARFEAAILRAGMTSFREVDPRESDPATNVRLKETLVVWKGCFDLRALFDRGGRKVEPESRSSICLIWREGGDGRLRVVDVPASVADLLEPTPGQSLDLRESALEALHRLGLVDK